MKEQKGESKTTLFGRNERGRQNSRRSPSSFSRERSQHREGYDRRRSYSKNKWSRGRSNERHTTLKENIITIQEANQGMGVEIKEKMSNIHINVSE